LQSVGVVVVTVLIAVIVGQVPKLVVGRVAQLVVLLGQLLLVAGPGFRGV